MFGKRVTDLQNNITVGANAITGTLNFVSDYIGFSGKASEQSGHYLAIHCDSYDADYITVELIGGTSGERRLDSDGIIILRIADVSQKVQVKAYKNDRVMNLKVYSLAGITLGE